MQKKEQTENKGFEQITGLNVVKKLTVPTGARMCRIEAATQAVRWRDDGTAPSTTVGMTIAAGGFIEYDGELTRIQFIEAAASAVLNVSYYA